jgi:hypothetical protein
MMTQNNNIAGLGAQILGKHFCFDTSDMQLLTQVRELVLYATRPDQCCDHQHTYGNKPIRYLP